MDKRWHRVQWGSGHARQRTSAANWRQPLLWERGHEAFAQMHGRRRRVFCASLADVFDNEVPAAWRVDLLRLIEQTPNLDWLLLTKRIGNVNRSLDEAAELMPEVLRWPLTNVWIGATMVNQAEYDRDVPKLLATPASVRFLSIEPMLGPIDLGYLREWTASNRRLIDWVIVGGESGHKARAIRPGWVESIRRQCAGAGVPFFFKQWGGRTADAGGCELGAEEIKAWPCAM